MSCICIYENDEKNEQLDKLKTSMNILKQKFKIFQACRWFNVHIWFISGKLHLKFTRNFAIFERVPLKFQFLKVFRIIYFICIIDFDLLIANPTRLLEILKENETLKSILETITFLIVDDYIQFRKTQMMDDVKKLVSFLKVN